MLFEEQPNGSVTCLDYISNGEYAIIKDGKVIMSGDSPKRLLQNFAINNLNVNSTEVNVLVSDAVSVILHGEM